MGLLWIGNNVPTLMTHGRCLEYIASHAFNDDSWQEKTSASKTSKKERAAMAGWLLRHNKSKNRGGRKCSR
jgi:hypothetical protein